MRVSGERIVSRPGHRRVALLTAAVSGAAASMLCPTPRAGATVLLYEPFSYTAGERLGGSGTSPVGFANSGFGQSWYARGTQSNYQTDNDTLVSGGSLGYAGLAPGVGNSVDYGVSGASGLAKYSDSISLGAPITPVVGQSVYYSFMVKINGTVNGPRAPFIALSKDASDLASAGSALANTGSGSNTPQPAGVFMRPNGDSSASYQLGVGKNNGDAIGQAAGAGSWQVNSPIGTPTANQTGNVSSNPNAGLPATYFIVAKYTFGDTVLTANGQKDKVSFYVNPASFTLGDNAAEALAPGNSYYAATDAYGTATLDSDAIRSLVLIGHRQNTDNSVAVSVDEVRVGTTWADVTPRQLTWDGDGAGGANPSNSSGSWETAGNFWNGTANVTWGSGESATFGTGSGAGSATVTLGAPQTAGVVTFAAASPTYTLAGSGLTISPYGGIVANQSANIAAPITLAAGEQTIDVAAAATLTAGDVGGAGALVKTGAGTAVVNHVRAAGLAVSGGVLQIAPGAGAAGVSKVGPLSISGGGKIDLKDNKLITASPLGTWDGSAYTDVGGLVDAGRGNASNAQWDGGGIVTTDTRAVNNNDLVSIGTAKVGAIKGIADGDTTTFAGQTVLGSDTVAMTTWGGDANLDGKINIDDYGQIDFNVSSSGSVFGWYNGDFNYDGKINIDDYGIIDFNVTAQNSIFPTGAGGEGRGVEGVAAVPEPASVGTLLLSLGAVARRRRRREARARS